MFSNKIEKYDCPIIDIRSIRKQSQKHKSESLLTIIRYMKKIGRSMQREGNPTQGAPLADRFCHYLIWGAGLVVFVIAAVQSYFT